jgi:hypothetical protein
LLQKFDKGSAHILETRWKNGYVLKNKKICAGYGCDSTKRVKPNNFEVTSKKLSRVLFGFLKSVFEKRRLTSEMDENLVWCTAHLI